MAELVAAIGVPHSPQFPSQHPKDGPSETARTYRTVKEHLEAARPDAIVVVANDHFNTFFLDNFPTFAIGLAEASFGPNDGTRMPRYDFPVHAGLAAHVLKAGMEEGIDFAVTQEFSVDHSMMVALHFLTDGVRVPVVPSGSTPSSSRCRPRAAATGWARCSRARLPACPAACG